MWSHAKDEVWLQRPLEKSIGYMVTFGRDKCENIGSALSVRISNSSCVLQRSQSGGRKHGDRDLAYPRNNLLYRRLQIRNMLIRLPDAISESPPNHCVAGSPAFTSRGTILWRPGIGDLGCYV